MNPNTPCGSGREPHDWRESGYGWECRVCGTEMDLTEDDAEPIGSCDNCGANVYAGGVDEDLCDQCAWYVYKANEDTEGGDE